VKEIPVQAGDKVGEAIVVAGLAPGDKVVLKPAEKLRDGAAVKHVAK
jgi:hypothetical protein